MISKILVCSTQPHLTRAIALHLLRDDLNVWTVSKPEEAQERLLAVQPDLLIVEIDLPQEKGWDLLKVACEGEEFPVPRLIALTTRPVSVIHEEAQFRGLEIDWVIPQPFNPRQLRKQIADWSREGSDLRESVLAVMS